MAAVICPTVNSYKRIGVGAPQSGSTWAPAYVTYGGNNRSLMLRVPEGGRVENRAWTARRTRTWPWRSSSPPGSTASTAAWTRASPTATTCSRCRPRRSPPRGIRALPQTLLHAADELVTDDVLRAALGKTPDGDFIDYYAEVKRDEFRAWHSVVTDWEVERYLTLF